MYANREHAGAILAQLEVLAELAGRRDVVVLGLPRGGVPVAAPIAAALSAPLDVLVVRKLGLPRQPELAMGAIAGIGDRIEVVRNDLVIERAGVSAAEFNAVCRRETEELHRRETAYRGHRGRAGLGSQVVIVVDDGLATGATMRSAVIAVRTREPSRIVAAVPIGSPRTCAELSADVDDLVCPWAPEDFMSVGEGYRDFSPTEDAEVTRLLA